MKIQKNKHIIQQKTNKQILNIENRRIIELNKLSDNIN